MNLLKYSFNWVKADILMPLYNEFKDMPFAGWLLVVAWGIIIILFAIYIYPDINY